MRWNISPPDYLLPLLLVAALGLPPAAGCGDSADGSSSPASASEQKTVTNQEFCNKLMGTYCEKLGYCARPDVYPVEQCKMDTTETCLGDDPPDKKVATQGKLDRCINDVNNLSCESADRGVTPQSCKFDDEA
jgi:hypothetical protein